MFFRRKKKVEEAEEVEKESDQPPTTGKDGVLYIEEGEDYDSDEYETDSDYSSNGEEEEIVEVEEEDDDDIVKGEEYKEDDDMIEEETMPQQVENTVSTDVEGDDTRHLHDNSIVNGSLEMEKEPAGDASFVNEPKESLPLTNEKDSKELLDDVSLINEPYVEKLSHDEKISNELDEEDDEDEEVPWPSLESKSEHEEELGQELLSDQENDDDDNEEEDEDEEEEQPTTVTTLSEKRSLLALAAEHDRVDIIKTILQSVHPNTNQKQSDSTGAHLIQLLLNNRIIGSKTISENGLFTHHDIEDVFLPPLHIAIASSSTNAASCLLRMGADPSIRPSIPKEWDGPVWEDDISRNNGFGSPKKGKVDTANYWRKLNGINAWEVAFGSESRNSKNGEGTGGEEKKKSWFGWSSPKSTDDDDLRKFPSFDIAPSKLDGIKNAFTAEALRAIGSDEVNRLRELLGSGLDSPPKNQHSGGLRSVEIGGKDLIGWCVEMNALRCSEMLGGLDDKKKKENTAAKVDKVVEKVTQPVKTEEKNKDSFITKADEEAAKSNLRILQTKLEENRMLAGSLSLVLDTLAEEVSLTQGLLYQQGDSANSALVSQVRTLKEKRIDIENEISTWESNLGNRNAELKMVSSWWMAKGGSRDFIEKINSGMVASIKAGVTDSENNSTSEGIECFKMKIVEMSNQVSLSENKVSKLRSSITYLAEENTRNLVQVEKMGLDGAVNLARKLKEEVKEKEDILQNLKDLESACSARVSLIRTELDNLSTRAAIANEREVNKVENTREAKTTTVNGNNVRTNSGGDDGELVEYEYYDEEEDCYIEYVDHSDDSDIEYEYYTDSDDEDNIPHSKVIPNSEVIQSGKSTALVLKQEQRGLLTFRLWELLVQRVIGLSKRAIKETAQSNGIDVDGFAKLPRAMIV